VNRPLPSLIPSEVGAIDLNRSIAASASPRLMKQILLRIAGIGPEVGARKPKKALGFGTAFREIKLAQRLHHPNIDGEGALKSVGEEQNTICDLLPYPRQTNEHLSRFGQGQMP